MLGNRKWILGMSKGGEEAQRSWEQAAPQGWGRGCATWRKPWQVQDGEQVRGQPRGDEESPSTPALYPKWLNHLQVPRMTKFSSFSGPASLAGVCEIHTHTYLLMTEIVLRANTTFHFHT